MKKIVLVNCGECPYMGEYIHKDRSIKDICTKFLLVIEDDDEIHDNCELAENDQ